MPRSSPTRGSPRARRRMRAPVKATLAVLATTVLLSGCGLSDFKGVHSLPLPGGADVGDHPYTVQVLFRNVTDLVPNSGVRVNDVPVGRVSSIELAKDSWLAEVTIVVNGRVDLPGNARAAIRQSSLLGEKYVQLSKPPESVAPVGRLGDGDVIPVQRTGRSPEVEEVLGALSLLLNGGGIAQIQNIAEELNAALNGRESDVRSLLNNLDELVGELDEQRDDITAALDAVNRLSATLEQQRENIDVALRDLGPGLKVLNRQREELVTMLEALDELSKVATNVVNRTKEDLIHNLEKLQPVLRNLAAAGSDLPESLQILFTYPFTDYTTKGIKGDYTNLYANLDLNLGHILKNLGRSRGPLLPLPNPGEGNDGRQRIPRLPLPLPPTGLLPDPGAADTPDDAKRDEKKPDDSGGLLGPLLGGL